MLPLIYTNPTAAGLFLAACLVWLVPEMIGMLRQMAKVSRKADGIQDRGSLVILLGLQWAGLALNFLLAWLFPAAAILWQRTAALSAGADLHSPGCGLALVCHPGTGRLLYPRCRRYRDQPVVQHGPYRLIRHPAYSGTFLTMLGVGLAMTNWASLVALLVCVFLGHFYRVSIEEKALIRTIGQPYIEYMRRTKRFIPWVF